jgi:diphosphomevalonate decarboxylase
MGKTEAQGNHPTNASLSYTLEHLRTFVRLSEISESQDRWQLLSGPEYQSMELSAKGQERFLRHLGTMKKIWGISQNFLVESANNFPADCGLASSASSFAALTLAAAEMFQKIQPQPRGADLKYLSEISRMGSGSSCRSLFSPWALWQAEYAEPLKLEYTHLHHLVVIVEDGKKAVSSSEAHQLVTTSPRFAGRVERADLRLKDLIQALRFKDWPLAVQICWDEFMDMHRLFETSTPAFSYMTEDSKTVIAECKSLFDRWGDGPLVTMDAGANVHLLFRSDQLKSFNSLKAHFSEKFQVFASSVNEDAV